MPFDAQTGQELPSLNEKSDGRIHFAFSPDGKRLATAGKRSKLPRIKVCDTETGQELFTFQQHTNTVTGLAFSPDSKLLASSSRDKTLRIWDLQTGEEIRALKGHTDGVESVDFSPDGQRLVSTSTEVKVWDLQKDPERLALDGYYPAISPDFKLLASAAADNTVKVWDARSGRQTHTLRGHTNPVLCLAFSPDGKRLASGDGTFGWGRGSSKAIPVPGVVKIWDTQSGKEILSLQGHTHRLHSLAFSPDGRRLASESWSGGEVKVWDAQTGQELLGLKPRVGFPYSRLVFSPDGKRFAASGMTVWDAETGKGLHFKDGDQSVTFSPDGKRQAGLARDGMVKVWDAQTRQELLAFTPGRTTGWLLSLAFSPDGKRLAGAALDGTVTVWDAQTGQEMLTFEHPVTIGGPNRTETHTVSFSPDGHRLGSAFWDGTVRIWDATPLPEKP